ncbi:MULTISPECIES: hypothetical protein [Halorussus]|uniref:hypothetical protein n=1 Tax=Halorussus TaxID=1070314 RepID=UPI000E219043|nr:MULTISPECIES: hypothetical protein [Halorussus]NHN59827.1 hypothetical protein [Halorussus sp. JP-T4]
MLAEIVREAVRAFGVQGVSAGVLALLVAVALYAHKLGSAGSKAVHAGSTVRHDLQVVALVLAGLLVLGVATLDVARARELAGVIGRRLAQLPVEQWVAGLV